MLRKTRFIWARYLIPPLTVGVAHLLTTLLWPFLHANRSLLFITAVMVSATYGGLGPALLASALASLASAFFYLPPAYSLDIGLDDALRLIAFVIVAAFVSWLSAQQRRSKENLRQAHAQLEARVRDRTADLTAINAALRQEIAERQRAEERILAYQLRLRSLAAELSLTEERQRRRIATTLHDAIGHTLAVSVIRLRSLLASNPPEASSASLSEVCTLIEQSIQHTRSLTLELSPPILYELGLVPAVEWLVERLQKQHWLAISVKDHGEINPMDDEVRGLLFSAIRELLVNVIKHAHARSATVSIERLGDLVEVLVADDGQGFDSGRLASANAGFGIFNLRERLASMGGRLEVTSAPGQGCRVLLRVPLMLEGARLEELPVQEVPA